MSVAAVGAGVLALVVTALVAGSTAPAYAAQPRIGLGTAAAYSVLAGTTVTNTGPTVVVTGDLGVSPGSAVTGFPPGLVTAGATHAADANALQAQNDLTTGYNDAAGRTPVTAAGELGNRRLVAGVYGAATALSLTGTVTLDAEGDPDAVFIFQAGSTLITAANSTVALINGASPCNVFWQVGSSATLGTNTTFVGTIMALTSADLQTGATLQGRVLARNGAVTLDTNTITRPNCAAVSTPTPTDGPDDGGSGGGGSDDGGPGGGGPGDGGPGGGGPGTSGTPGQTGTGTPGTPVVPNGNPDTGIGGAASSASSLLTFPGVHLN